MNADLNRQLFRAVKQGDYVAVRNLIHAGADVNANPDNPLWAAASRGDRRMLRLLLDAGADVNKPRISPLYLAMLGRHFDAVRMLVDAGAATDVLLQGVPLVSWVPSDWARHDEVVALLTPEEIQSPGKRDKMKPVRFSPHAEANLKAREIEREDAGAAVRNPERREIGRPPREIVTRRYFDKVTGTTMVLRAVIEESENEIAVITLYKTSKLKKYLPEGTK
jgi:hypothetical protein